MKQLKVNILIKHCSISYTSRHTWQIAEDFKPFKFLRLINLINKDITSYG